MDKAIGIIKRVEDFVVYDGVKSFTTKLIYDNWLTGLDFNTYSNSSISFEGTQLRLFGNSNSSELKISDALKNNNLTKMAQDYNLILTGDGNHSRLVAKGHEYESFYFLVEKLENKSFAVIYGIGGSRSPESLYIHGVWEVSFL